MRKQSVERLTGVALAAVWLCVVGSANAASAPPFTSATAPATITSPLMTFTPYDATEGIFTVAVGNGVTCPDTPVAYTLTFSDPSGTASITTPDPCAATWGPITPPVTTANNFTIDLLPGVNLAAILNVPGISLTQQQNDGAIASIDLTNYATDAYPVCSKRVRRRVG